MGVNNKKRRASKQRKRASGWDSSDAFEVAEREVHRVLRLAGARKAGDDEMSRWAEDLVRRVRPVPHHVIESVLADLLARLLEAVAEGGWGRADLSELVRRAAGDRHVSTLAAIPRLDTTERLASGLRVAALLSIAPLLEGQIVTGVDSRSSADHPKLAQVRALLAKAESTEFDEEAEALSAKAQELIARYSLGRLLEAGAGRTSGSDPCVRRIWLDAPYVGAKASLVHEVARANRCRTAVAEQFGFTLVVGAAEDLDAVELLVTSLMVQANTAMLRHGQRHDRSGRARTRSFRHSFLVAYAARIGERLRAVTDAAESRATSTGNGAGVSLVLRDHQTRVTEAFTAMMPRTVSKATSVSNGEGWACGLAAADLAQLDVHGALEDRAG